MYYKKGDILYDDRDGEIFEVIKKSYELNEYYIRWIRITDHRYVQLHEDLPFDSVDFCWADRHFRKINKDEAMVMLL